MLRCLKSKIKRVQQQPVKTKVPRDYIQFKGSEEYYIRNNEAWLLEESRSTFYGKWNPINHFSLDDLNNMNVGRVPFHKEYYYKLHRGCWEGQVVLIKRATSDNDDNTIMFLGEIVVATQMATQNNVHKLLGCCLETKFPILVYDGTVDVTLRKCIERKKVRVLEWKDRLRIAWEISHVTAYLHTAFSRPVVHRKLKPSNVFLDHDNSAKVSDFGLAISIPFGEEMVGTFRGAVVPGYIPPECFFMGGVAESTDVYSFGMILLGILTGKNVVTMEFSTWLWDRLRENNIMNIIDPLITAKATTTIVDSQLIASLKIVRKCVSLNKDDRPAMMEVATQLKNLMAAQQITDSIPPQINTEGQPHKIYSGSKENRERNEALLLEESLSLLNSGVKPIYYLSVDDLNNMKVEHDLISWGDDWLCYIGSWEGRHVMVKHPQQVTDLTTCNKMRLRLLREILIATEMAVVSNNVQKLLGCCLETKFPILVYEWHAHVLTNLIGIENKPNLEWNDRLRIAREISGVVSYLHTMFPKPIIYNFLEPVYVFLDEFNTVKMSNFSRSLSIPKGEEFMVMEDCLILYTMDHYIPPEYSKNRKVGQSSDVYTFGVLFLMLLTGMRVYEYGLSYFRQKRDDMITYVKKSIINNYVIRVLDSVITRNGLTTVEEFQLEASVQLAMRCVEEDHGNRPTMVQVTTELSNIIRCSEFIPNL